ncbi:hypothetical protein BC937DRAFT_87231 [Endogone sp. FLAS-F59071]|nr:hypothetical protein BC937DRAFT_87231 [Endogone sp. FLAS-F59071]|eukprot:RUS12698.1 hypothetical protein BC937DRAFT_87231 [Endogone sp. FLAS-F59071]
MYDIWLVDGLSFTTKAFIRALLVPDPRNRLTATQALAHPWLDGATASNHDLLDNVRENFNPKKAFRSAVEAIQAANTMKRMSTRFETPPSPTSAVAKNAAA